jgi:hypothetical protein
MNALYKKLVVLLLLIHLSRCLGVSNHANCPVISISSESQNSESIEIPTRKQRSDQSQHRPIVELVLGMLDTLHSSSKSELKRLKARRARQNDVHQTTLNKTTEAPILSKLYVTKTSLKKRFST